jgi:S-adenosyl-L-methionine hydrolase (adenosine-forming)
MHPCYSILYFLPGLQEVYGEDAATRSFFLKLITLLTDFGLEDGYPAIMKGVILGITRSVRQDVQIVDITHAISPQDVLQGALALRRAAAYFPPETIHVAVVDPGVGTSRRPIAARIGNSFFVGPDNGLFSLLIEQAAGEPVQFVHLDRPEYWLPVVSRGFHGRDIFAPAAAHLACDVPLEQLGSPISDPVRIQLSKPRRTERGWTGEIIHIDHFGNLATNIDVDALSLAGHSVSAVRIAGESIPGLALAFGDRQPGELVALVDSDGLLAVAVVNGSASNRLEAWIGSPVEVLFES